MAKLRRLNKKFSVRKNYDFLKNLYLDEKSKNQDIEEKIKRIVNFIAMIEGKIIDKALAYESKKSISSNKLKNELDEEIKSNNEILVMILKLKEILMENNCICKGSLELGTACMECEKCKKEIKDFIEKNKNQSNEVGNNKIVTEGVLLTNPCICYDEDGAQYCGLKIKDYNLIIKDKVLFDYSFIYLRKGTKVKIEGIKQNENIFITLIYYQGEVL